MRQIHHHLQGTTRIVLNSTELGNGFRRLAGSFYNNKIIMLIICDVFCALPRIACIRKRELMSLKPRNLLTKALVESNYMVVFNIHF